MSDALKKQQLKKYKGIATGLFILMALIFVATTILQKTNDSHWIGYVRAFSEAAMVGALADWFAVTALFKKPMGLPIPHTNLIENSKQKLGDNLGNFVVENFLAPQNIRPYILQLKVSNFVGEWLSKEKNQTILVEEGSDLILNIINKLDDETVVKFISSKVSEMTSELKINQLIGNGLEYLVDRNEHQKIITNIAKQVKDYVAENEEMVRERVKKESYSLIPKFVDDKIAEKITKGVTNYFEEMELDENHSLRSEISNKLYKFASDLKTERWKEDFDQFKSQFLQGEKMDGYAKDIWNSIKNTIIEELSKENSQAKNYIRKNLNELALNLSTDEKLQHKIDHWIRVTAYKYILKNTHQFGNLISSTVGNWEGKELSEKLELEVGKDLQFIRINGTLVGGLVGLIIYTIAHFFI